MRLILNSAGGGNTHISSNMTTRVKKKSTSIYPPICSRMEDKLFQFYRNECFMSCLCFPESVLNSYILLNAWMFSTKNAPCPLSFLGFQFQNTRLVKAGIFLPFGDLSYLSFFLINRKRNSLIILCLEKTTITICVYFLKFPFPCLKSSCFHLLLSMYILFFSHSLTMNMPNLYNHKKQGRYTADHYKYPCSALFFSKISIR